MQLPALALAFPGIFIYHWIILQMVRNEYDELFEGDVAAVHIVYNTNDLDSLVQEYDTALRDLEDLIDDYASQKARDKTVKRKQVSRIGPHLPTCGN